MWKVFSGSQWYKFILKHTHTITATRTREAGEITPVSAEQSATVDNDEANYRAGNAIDLDLNTRSRTAAGSDGTVWLKVNLDKVHCVKQVIWYRNDGTPYNWFWIPSYLRCKCPY